MAVLHPQIQTIRRESNKNNSSRSFKSLPGSIYAVTRHFIVGFTIMASFSAFKNSLIRTTTTNGSSVLSSRSVVVSAYVASQFSLQQRHHPDSSTDSRYYHYNRYAKPFIRSISPSSSSSSSSLYSTQDATMASSTSKSSSTLQQRLPVVVLKRNKQSKSFRDGGQLVFGGSIDRAPKNLKMGDIVQVYVPDKVSNNNSSRDDGDSKTNDKNNTKMETPTPITLIGWGVYNPESMYRVRLLCHGIFGDEDVINAIKNNLDDDPGSGRSYDQAVLRQILMKNFERAINTRRALGLPSASVTDTYRLVNGEGDSLSGLAVDVVGDQVAVVMSSAAWCEIHQHTIIDCLQTVLPDHYEIIWKKTPSRLQQDGYHVKVNSKEERDEENLENGKRSTGLCNYDRLVIATENEIKYNIWPFRDGQKTSVYCDQRINRWNLAQHCSGKNVLDLCCYHGGFSLNAAKNGAMNVIGVDSSQDAVDACKANAELNNMGNVDFVKSDISDFMKICSQKFDVVVLDPPKLAPSVSGLQRASRKYHSLNRDALKLINDSGGLFMTCTCSAAMTQQDGGQYFLQMVHQAALAAKRQVTLISVHGAAPCHTQSPITLPAGKYLTAALFMVHPK